MNFMDIINKSLDSEDKYDSDDIYEDGDGGGGDAGGADDPNGNTSDSHPGYLTPNAFGNKSSCKCKGQSCSCNTKTKNESTYKEYKCDSSYSSDKEKLNKTINTLYSLVYSIEHKLKHVSKLKHETGMDDSHLRKNTKVKLIKLKDRINNIIELVDSIYNNKGDI